MHRRLALILLALPVLLLPGGGVRAAESEAPTKARFGLNGLHRSAVVALLGEPNKIKQANGTETLIYKLQTVAEDHLPARDERLIELPGIGRCVRRIHLPVEGFDDSLEFEPTTVTEDGHMEGGSMTQSRSSSTTIDLDEPRPKNAPTNERRTGKVRLFVVVGQDGNVTEWTTKGGR